MGSLDLANCTSLTHLPEGLKVKDDINLNNLVDGFVIPKGLEIGGDIYVDRHRFLYQNNILYNIKSLARRLMYK